MLLSWKKADGLIPAIIQDNKTNQVMMLGYMNEDSFKATQETGLVTFFSRSRQSLWVKGETSGNQLKVVDISADCDQDAILIRAEPTGPVCHRNTESCFDHAYDFLDELSDVIQNRMSSADEKSYVASLIQSGTDRIAQKVGEEAVETVIAAKNENVHLLENEAADLLFHLMVLLQYRKTNLSKVVTILKERHPTGSPDPRMKN